MPEAQPAAAPDSKTAPAAEKQPDKPNGEVRKPGTDYLDFSKYPEDIRGDIEPRFKRLYGHVKTTERQMAQALKGLKELADHNRALEDKLNKYQSDHTESRRVDVVSELKKQIAKAGEDGDYGRQADLYEQLAEVKSDKPKPVKQEFEDRRETEPTAAQLTNTESRAIESWASEKDDRGRLRRPWTQPGHPQQGKAAALVNAMLEDPDYQGSPMEEILSEVDRLMVKPGRQAAAVLTSDTDARPRAEPPMQLSGDEKYVAERLYPDMAAKEAHARYAKQKKELKK